MGFRGIYSAILVTGLAQMTPAIAQSQVPLREAEGTVTASPAAAIPDDAPESESAPAPSEKVAEEKQQPAVSEREAPEEASATPAATPKPMDPADKDLAAAPPEEVKPAKIDPNTARRALASAQAPAPRTVPQPALASAAAAEPAREEQEGYAERVIAAERGLQPEIGGDAALARSQRVAAAQWHAPEPAQQPELGGDAAYARNQRVATSQWRPAPAPRPVPQAVPDRATFAARDEQDADAGVVRDDRLAVAPPRAMPYDRDDRDDRDAQPAYGDRYRDAPPAYAAEDRAPTRDYGDRAMEDGTRYAIQDRIGPDGPIRSVPESWQWGNRRRAPIAELGDDAACDGARTDRLQQRIRQEAARGLIDPRAAQDLNDETGHAEELRRSYCASGMNDWREERLDRQYAQIEDRIRYEEDQSGRR
jgi:hypothetical protein